LQSWTSCAWFCEIGPVLKKAGFPHFPKLSANATLPMATITKVIQRNRRKKCPR